MKDYCKKSKKLLPPKKLRALTFRAVQALRKLDVKKSKPTTKRKKPYRRVIQRHHITYEPPWVVSVYKGEHYVLTQLQRRTHVSIGFIISLTRWLENNKGRAVDLDDKEVKQAIEKADKETDRQMIDKRKRCRKK